MSRSDWVELRVPGTHCNSLGLIPPQELSVYHAFADKAVREKKYQKRVVYDSLRGASTDPCLHELYRICDYSSTYRQSGGLVHEVSHLRLPHDPKPFAYVMSIVFLSSATRRPHSRRYNIFSFLGACLDIFRSISDPN